MRAVIQRVVSAKVEVEGRVSVQTGLGLLVLLGISKDDNEQDASYLANKILNLRIFDDEQGRMNLSLLDIKGEMLLVSQFTLYGDCRKGNRPSYDKAANNEKALALYKIFLANLKNSGLQVEEGVFGAFMNVTLLNSGPVTILADSKKQF